MMSRIAVTLFALVALVMPAYAQTPLPMPAQSMPDVTMPAREEVAATVAAEQGFGESLWGSADYLLGWVRGTRVPVLVTTSPPGTAQVNAGVLGASGTSTVIGGEPHYGDLRSGFRLGAGGWLTADKSIGVDVGFFMTESRANLFFASSDGSTILARPFTNANNGKPASVLVAYPGIGSGSVGVSANSGQLYGAHFELQESLIDNRHFRLKSLIGYRFLRFDDGLEIQQSQSPTGGGFFPGTRIDVHDGFAAQNEFHGVDIGFQTEFLYERWSLGFLSKVAVGNLHRMVVISGDTLVTSPGKAPAASTGGLLALVSNIGRHGSNDWVGAPEIGANVGFDVTSNIRLRLGYSLLFLFDVARAADQVDPNVNPNLVPPVVPGQTVNRPSFNLQQSNLWLQTVNVGMEFRF